MTPAQVNVNGVAMVTVTASNPDGEALTYTYIVSGGLIVGNGATATWTAPATIGANSVTVTVSDGNGGQASSNTTLNVLSTMITGIASFLAGTSGDLSHSKVSIYTSWDNWNANQPIKFAAVTGSGASVSFTLTNVNPGNYYLDVWKDADNDGMWSVGDYVGWYGSGGLGSPALTESQISERQTFTSSIQMCIIAKGFTFKELKHEN